MWDPYAEFQSETLPNGLTVHAAHWPGRPWEAMGFLIHSGAEQDLVGLEGLAHFVEHLVSGNTDTPQKDMRNFFKDCGGTVNFGRAGYPQTNYGFFVPSDRATLTKSLSFFGHMLFSAKLEKFIEREREVIVNEFLRYYSMPFKFDLAMRERKALYAGYWLERSTKPLGAPESINKITQNNLQLYYDGHYTPANMSIVAVGGKTLSELIKLIAKSPLAINKKGQKTPFPVYATGANPPSEFRHVFEVSNHIKMKDSLEIGAYRSVAKIPGNINGQAIRILDNMLNDILNEEIREQRAWTYSIGSSRYNFRHFYEFLISCDAFAIKALNEIEKVIEGCITSIESRDDLFRQVKQRVLISTFMIDQSGSSICGGAIDDLITDQHIVSFEECRRKIKKVTMNDIRNLLQWLQPEQRWTLLTRP